MSSGKKRQLRTFFRRDKKIKKEYLISAELKFDAAHRLSDYAGKCRRIHGHAYRVIITIKGEILNNWGALMDFGDLKNLLKIHVDDKYDHKLILKNGDLINKEISGFIYTDDRERDDWIVWMDGNPTAENMARDIYNDISASLKAKSRGVELVEVIVYETETNKAVYGEVK